MPSAHSPYEADKVSALLFSDSSPLRREEGREDRGEHKTVNVFWRADHRGAEAGRDGGVEGGKGRTSCGRCWLISEASPDPSWSTSKSASLISSLAATTCKAWLSSWLQAQAALANC